MNNEEQDEKAKATPADDAVVDATDDATAGTDATAADAAVKAVDDDAVADGVGTAADAAADTAADDTAADDTADDKRANVTALKSNAANASARPKVAKKAGRSTSGASMAGLVVAIALSAVLVLSTAFSAWAYLALYRPEQATNDKVAATVLKNATDGTVALLSYSPETLDGDFTNAKTHLTGDFLNYYTDFTQKIVTPAAKDKQVKTSAVVVRSAISQLQSTSAEVLLFINQATTSKENPDGTFTASSVKVGMQKVGDNWLISTFDPV